MTTVCAENNNAVVTEKKVGDEQKDKQEQQQQKEEKTKEKKPSPHEKVLLSKEKLHEISLMNEKMCRAVKLLNDTKQNPKVCVSCALGFQTHVPLVGGDEMAQLLQNLLEFSEKITIVCSGINCINVPFTLLTLSIERE